jgi:tetratricopeptide (TPR) repeat protein
MNARNLAQWLMIGAMATAVLAPRPLLAKPDAGKTIADEAAGHFKAGRFLQAAEMFERSFALNPSKLVRLRNAGRAYEEAGKLEYACLIFERYLQLAPQSQESAEVKQRLVRLREQLALSPPAKTDPAAAASPRADQVPEKIPVSLSVPTAGATAEADRSEPRTAAWATAGIGATLLLGGVGWAAANESKASDIEANAASQGSDYSGGIGQLRADREDVRSARLLSWGTAGLGAALVGGGLAWALWPKTAPTRDGLLLAIRF